MDNIIESLKTLYNTKRNGFGKFLLGPNATIYRNYIIENTKFLKNNTFEYSLSYRLWFLFNNQTTYCRCQNKDCNCILDDPKYFLGLSKGFRKYCCLKHAATDENVLQHREETCLKKYGAKNVMLSDFGKEQLTQTFLKRYGVKVFPNTEKAKQTRYQKNNGKYHSDDFVKKVKQTKKIRHGNENWINKQKIKKTLLEKYGVTCSFNIKHVEELSAKAILQRSYDNVILNNKFDKPCFNFEYYLKTHKNNIQYEFECKQCGKHFMSYHKNGLHKKCPHCFPKIEGTSILEKQISDFILQSINPLDVILNTRSIIYPQELDIYIPEKKIAIEFDGLYWHSEEEKPDKNYHLNKTLSCEKQGIHLIHIFENEWLTKQEIVKSRLKNLLGIYDKTIYARKCQIKEVDSKTSKEFQEENHIQGAVNSKVNLGLYYQDELISLMTFGKCRFDKHHEWELLRFCNKLGYHIPGAASKLLKHFEKTYKPTSLVSYADRRWSQGKVYEKLGFIFSHASAPNYWYIDQFNILESRVKYQKHKLKKLLENFDENKTEVENMKANGYNRIFDCGNLVYEKIYNSKI